MIRPMRNFVLTAAALFALAVVSIPTPSRAQTQCPGGCNEVVITRPTPQPPPPTPPSVNSNQIAPQIKALQNLTDPIIINIVPGEVVDRSALNRLPPQPNLIILGQGGPTGPGNPFPRINGMPPPGVNNFAQDELLIFGTLTPDQIARLASLGLSLIDQQTLGTLGITLYKFHIDNGNPVRTMIGQVQQLFPFPLTQPNYFFRMVQQAAATAQQEA